MHFARVGLPVLHDIVLFGGLAVFGVIQLVDVQVVPGCCRAPSPCFSAGALLLLVHADSEGGQGVACLRSHQHGRHLRWPPHNCLLPGQSYNVYFNSISIFLRVRAAVWRGAAHDLRSCWRFWIVWRTENAGADAARTNK